jgi:hypothetical protein
MNLFAFWFLASFLSSTGESMSIGTVTFLEHRSTQGTLECVEKRKLWGEEESGFIYPGEGGAGDRGGRDRGQKRVGDNGVDDVHHQHPHYYD